MHRPFLPVLLVIGPAMLCAAELPSTHPAWIAPEGPARGEALPAVLTMPPGWSVGDAAVILLHPGAAAPWQASLTHELLAQDAAVLDLAPRGRPSPPWIAGAVRNLVLQQGAALVVAIGPGAEAEALASLAQRARVAPPDDPLRALAAAIVLAPTGIRYLPAATPAPEEAWPDRVPLLCAALARAVTLSEAGCVHALLPARPGLAALP